MLQRQVGRGELEVHAVEDVDGDRELAFLHFLDLRGLAAADRELRRPAHQHGVADLVAVAVELVLIAAIDEVRADEIVVEDHQRRLGDDVRSQHILSHGLVLLGGACRLRGSCGCSGAPPCGFPRVPVRREFIHLGLERIEGCRRGAGQRVHGRRRPGCASRGGQTDRAFQTPDGAHELTAREAVQLARFVGILGKVILDEGGFLRTEDFPRDIVDAG